MVLKLKTAVLRWNWTATELWWFFSNFKNGPAR